MKSRLVATEQLGFKITHVPPYKYCIHLWQYGLDPTEDSVWTRAVLLYYLFFATPPDKEWPTIDKVADVVDWVHDIHSYTHQLLKLASDWMKTQFDFLANCVGYQMGDIVWLYRPFHMKRKSSKIQLAWEGLYGVITWMNDVVYRIQWHSRKKMIVVHLDRPASYWGFTWDERPEGGSIWKRAVKPNPWGRKSGCCRNLKNCWPHHDIDMPVVSMITNATGMSLLKRRNGNTSVGYLGWSTLRKEQCDICMVCCVVTAG
jgi:hypothetical protein